MINNNYICALDIGSSKLSAVVAKVKKGQISALHFAADSSCGVKGGSIVDASELSTRISRMLRKLKDASGIKIRSLYTNISGCDILTKHVRSIIPLAERGNKVITLSDLEKVNEQARILGSSLEEEIIHQVPFSYSIDSKGEIINPIGLYSHRLEVDLYLICAKISSLQNISRVINQSGYELKDVFFSGIATGQSLFNKENRSGINILCDIGSDITEILVFKDGYLKDISLLKCGGDDLTAKLSSRLNLPFELAEDIKSSYASVGDSERVADAKEILIKKDSLYKPIKQKLVVEIVSAQAQVICQQIKGACEKITSLHEVNNFFVAGRTVFLEGFLEILETDLGISVKLGKITNPKLQPYLNVHEALGGHKYLTFVTCLGILCQALGGNDSAFNLPVLSDSSRNPLLRAINRVKEVYQEYF